MFVLCCNIFMSFMNEFWSLNTSHSQLNWFLFLQQEWTLLYTFYYFMLFQKMLMPSLTNMCPPRTYLLPTLKPTSPHQKPLWLGWSVPISAPGSRRRVAPATPTTMMKLARHVRWPSSDTWRILCQEKRLSRWWSTLECWVVWRWGVEVVITAVPSMMTSVGKVRICGAKGFFRRI